MKTKLIVCFGVFLLVILSPFKSMGGVIELSVGGSYTHSNYNDDSYVWNRRWYGATAYHFSENSGVEFSYQDAVERTVILNVQDTTYHDRIYSVNWIQSLLGNKGSFQPFFKVGVGQLNRNAEGSYASGGKPPSKVDAVTVVLSAGSKIYFTKSVALRLEATSYLTGGSVSTWKDNIAGQLGASFFF